MRRTTPVQLAVTLEKVERGGVLALAHVTVSISGIPIGLQGLKLRRGLDGSCQSSSRCGPIRAAGDFLISGYMTTSRGVL